MASALEDLSESGHVANLAGRAEAPDRGDPPDGKVGRIATWRDRISRLFRHNRLVISAELLFVVAIHLLEITDFPAILFTFPIASVSLRLRRLGWRGVGLRRPSNWLRTLGLGALIGVAYQYLELWLIEPLIVRWGGAPIDLSQFDRLPGSVVYLVTWIIIGWLLAAFIEEMVLRGYIINRFVDLLGDSVVGWTSGVLVGSVLFALGHFSLGLPGVISNFCFALVFAGLYFAAGRNLWLPIIAHGFYNSLIFVLIYLGLYP
jgi:membrane protease YdiL (CAAX protease family)